MTTEFDTTTENTEAPEALGTIEYIDPETLELEANVRDDVQLAEDFLASLREHGVLVPLTAVRDAEGHTVVREGQCRTLGAREVGLAKVPVFVLTETAAKNADSQTLERIVHQMVANDRRSALTEAQRARAIQTMLDTGASPTKIAKKLSIGTGDVKAAAVAAKSPVALEALDTEQMTFQEAAALVEFESDDHAVAQLIRAAGTRSFDHTVEQLRTARETEQRRQTAAAEWSAQGYTVLETYPRWDDLSCLSMRYLRTAEDTSATEADVKDPAHWAVYLTEDYAYFDRETGEPVDDDSVDDETRDDETLEPEEGLRHYNTVEERTVFVPEWYCLDYQGAGLTPAPSLRSRGGTPSAGGATGHDPEAEARQQEAERRERRKLLALNRLGDAAAVVRREYVTKLLARKTPPKGAATFIAYCLIRDRFIQSQNHGEDIAAELLGVKDFREVRALISDASTNLDPRAQVITLAIVLGALEARCTKDAWRSAKSGITGSAMYNSHTLGSDVYLRFLVETGYAPAEVEKIVLGERSADEVYDAELALSTEQ
jgi:ParB family transcriptional regulator, chromosome partitioning protein